MYIIKYMYIDSAGTHLSCMLVGDPDHGLYCPLLLDQLQAWSIGVWDIAKPILPMKGLRSQQVAEDRPRGPAEHRDLEHGWREAISRSCDENRYQS